MIDVALTGIPLVVALVIPAGTPILLLLLPLLIALLSLSFPLNSDFLLEMVLA
jgi:hypothetical protein